MEFNNKLQLEVKKKNCTRVIFKNCTRVIFIKGAYISLNIRCVILEHRKNRSHYNCLGTYQANNTKPQKETKSSRNYSNT